MKWDAGCRNCRAVFEASNVCGRMPSGWMTTIRWVLSINPGHILQIMHRIHWRVPHVRYREHDSHLIDSKLLMADAPSISFLDTRILQYLAWKVRYPQLRLQGSFWPFNSRSSANYFIISFGINNLLIPMKKKIQVRPKAILQTIKRNPDTTNVLAI